MSFLTFRHSIFKLILFFIYYPSFSQVNTMVISQDSRFEELLNKKSKINITNNDLNNYFKIQILTGNNEDCKNTLIDFRKKNKGVDATIIYNSPIYRVLVGKYNSRIEATKELLLYKKDYPNASIIWPTNN